MSKGLMILPIGAGVIGQDDVPLVRIMDSDETPTTITVYGVVDTVQPVTAVTWTVNGVEQSGDVSRSPVLELTNLQPETSYAITLRATNINGESSASARTITTKKITTVTPNDVLEGVSYYNLDVYYTGNIPTKDETDIVVNGRNVTVPTGYYPESETVSVSSEYIIPTGTKNISGNGTEDVTQYAEVNVNVQPPLYSPSNVDPTTSQQTIDVPTGYYGLGPVTVNGVTGGIDPNIQAGNIKKDVTILGVTGAFEGGIQPAGTLNIVNNGTYDITNYANVTVQVASGNFNELCFTALAANSKVGMSHTGTNTSTTKPTVYYSTDGRQTWTLWDFSQITLANVDDKVYFYGQNTNGFNYGTDNRSTFTTSGSLSVSGKIMSLITRYGDRDIPNSGCFAKLFSNCWYIIDAQDLELPLMTTDNCYDSMFFDCRGLKTPPQTLPALEVKYKSYSSMFYWCFALESTPDLPATIVGQGGYSSMFSDCYALTSIPSVLPATTLTQQCYTGMFTNCGGITKAPYLPAKTIANSSYWEMFKGCGNLNEISVGILEWNDYNSREWVNGVAATGTFYKMKDVNITVDSINGIPTGWTVFEIPIVIDNNNEISFNAVAGTTIYYTTDGTTPTTSSSLYTQPIDVTGLGSKFTLKYLSVYNGVNMPVMEYEYCYAFYIEALEDNTVLNVNNWRDNMLYSTNKQNWVMCNTAPSRKITLANTGDKVYFKKSKVDGVKLGVGALTTVSGTIKTGGYLEFAATGTITNNPILTGNIGNLFENCTGLIDASDLILIDNMTGYDTGWTQGNGAYYRMFKGCTNLVRTPKLPSQQLQHYCYKEMFMDCTSLMVAPDLPATSIGGLRTVYGNMFQGCTSLISTGKISFNRLDSSSYSCCSDMFNGCTSLSSVTLENCTFWYQGAASNWLYNVAQIGTFIKSDGLVIGTGTGQIPSSSANGIPAGWTVEDGTTEPRLHVYGSPIYRFVITGEWPNDGVTRAVGDIEVYDNNDTLISNSYIEIKVQNGVLDYDDYYWKREYGQRYILSDTGRQLVIETEMDNTGWYTEFDQYYKNCDDWQSRGYSDYEDCMCNENQMDCPPEP